MPSGPVASDPRGPMASGPMSGGPPMVDALPANAMARASLPSAAEPRPKQTGVLLALILVVVLILAGIAAILWMLGFLPL